MCTGCEGACRANAGTPDSVAGRGSTPQQGQQPAATRPSTLTPLQRLPAATPPYSETAAAAAAAGLLPSIAAVMCALSTLPRSIPSDTELSKTSKCMEHPPCTVWKNPMEIGCVAASKRTRHSLFLSIDGGVDSFNCGVEGAMRSMAAGSTPAAGKRAASMRRASAPAPPAAPAPGQPRRLSSVR